MVTFTEEAWRRMHLDADHSGRGGDRPARLREGFLVLGADRGPPPMIAA
jgi:hypothetical protein